RGPRRRRELDRAEADRRSPGSIRLLTVRIANPEKKRTRTILLAHPLLDSAGGLDTLDAVRLRYVFVFLLSAFVAGCGTSSETLVTPSPVSGRCSVGLNVSATSLEAP